MVKIRSGFVSNSSSTSFMVTNKTNETISVEEFLNLVMKGYTKYVIEKIEKSNEYHSDELYSNFRTEIEVDNGIYLMDLFEIAKHFEEKLKDFEMEYYENFTEVRGTTV